MIQVIPVIYVKSGKAVVFSNGAVLESSFALTESPRDLAEKFLDHGLNQLFVIDLDGLAKGQPQNLSALESISRVSGVEITFGGGISDNDSVRSAFDNGASKVTASSVAVNKSDLFSSWLISFGRRKIVLSADVVDNKVARLGDQKPLEKDILDFIEYFYLRGILYVKCSDISNNPENAGPSLSLYKTLKTNFPEIELIAGGGVRSLLDLENLKEAGVTYALVGKAFYDGTLDLKTIQKHLRPAA
jgi:phosphoribosylformimino-5-aminoimidazole carboxamide ribotide isomerase